MVTVTVIVVVIVMVIVEFMVKFMLAVTVQSSLSSVKVIVRIEEFHTVKCSFGTDACSYASTNTTLVN